MAATLPRRCMLLRKRYTGAVARDRRPRGRGLGDPHRRPTSGS